MIEASQREVLLAIVRGARRRLRARQLLHGASVVVAVAVGCGIVAAYGADHFRFAPAVVWTARALVGVVPLALAAWFLARRLSHPVSDLQLALYLEEHAPSLDARLVSAIECAARGTRAGPERSLEDQLVAEALEHSARAQHGRGIERPAMARSGGVLAGSMVLGAALLLLGPVTVRRGVAGLLPWARGPNPYAIAVSPGDTVVARGSDLKVTARLEHFTAEQVEIAVRRGTGEWQRFPMETEPDSARRAIVLFKLNDATEYFVAAGGVRSPVAHVNVADLPHVQRIDLEYHYPAYTGLPVQRVEDGGDIAALRGTRVRVKVIPTITPAGASLVVGGRDTVALAPQPDGGLAGDITVSGPSSYHVVFRTAAAGTIAGSGEYAIDALSDQPPVVRFRTPAHDLQVTSVEEVFTEAEARDDYGVARLDLVYRVNGAPEQVVMLGPGAGSHKEVVGSHTFTLEDLGLKPGDLIAYYARAREASHGGDARQATSDIYFLQVRPFDRDYRAADVQGGGGGGEGSFGALSQREREIVAGTFNVVRDSAAFSASAYRENLATLALAQGKLREDVTQLSERIQSRGIVGMDSTFAIVAAALDSAKAHMQEAERLLGERDPHAALGPEQLALQQTQRAEAAYKETQVARGGGGGAGGGGEQQSADDLADLFDLQMDKLKNQYEQVQRGERQQSDNQVDEALERLKELARRQQQENERLRARQQEQAAGVGGTSGGQRELAQQTEEMARQLERLAREQNRPDLSQTAERLRQASDAMRQAATQGAGAANGASARGRAALDRLREAQRQLEQERGNRLRRNVDDALRRADRLAGEQDKVRQLVDRLDPRGAQAAQQIAQLDQRKLDMARQTAELQNDIDSLSRESLREQPEASRKLGEAADRMRDAKLRDKILFSRGVIRGGSREYAQNFEEQIGADIEALRQQLAGARSAIGESKDQRIARALDRADDLVSGLESMQERLRAGQEKQQGQQGQEGQEGQEGQQGAPGGRRQEGQPGPVSGGARRWRGDRRQLQGELRQRVGDAEQLRGQLRQEGVEVGGLDRAVDRLRQLEGRLVQGDPRAVAALGSEVVEGLKQFEFAVRRQFAEVEEQRPFGLGADEVPEKYRKLVEQYYKALAGKKP